MPTYRYFRPILPTSNLVGQLIVSSPSNTKDPLSQSVILVTQHENKLITGIQINAQLAQPDLSLVASEMGLSHKKPEDPLWYGGNIGNSRIHIIHSLDWASQTTVAITEEIGVTNSIEVLIAISTQTGPSQYRACSGHWCINSTHHNWEICEATSELVFSDLQYSQHWHQCLSASVKQSVEESWPI
jgi:putative transcriptional regulator